MEFAPVLTELVWQGITVKVAYTQQAFGGPFDHIEIRAAEPLPITETGYRSHFIHPKELALFSSPTAFVLELLDEHSKTPGWKQVAFDARQGELF